jgi:hypothetical protein
VYRFNGEHYRGYMKSYREIKRREAFERRIQETKADTQHIFQVFDHGGASVLRCGTEECHQAWDIRHKPNPPQSLCPWKPPAVAKTEEKKKRIEEVAAAPKLSLPDRPSGSSARTKRRKR